jgi:hypothetical protein
MDRHGRPPERSGGTAPLCPDSRRFTPLPPNRRPIGRPECADDLRCTCWPPPPGRRAGGLPRDPRGRRARDVRAAGADADPVSFLRGARRVRDTSLPVRSPDACARLVHPADPVARVHWSPGPTSGTGPGALARSRDPPAGAQPSRKAGRRGAAARAGSAAPGNGGRRRSAPCGRSRGTEPRHRQRSAAAASCARRGVTPCVPPCHRPGRQAIVSRQARRPARAANASIAARTCGACQTLCRRAEVDG